MSHADQNQLSNSASQLSGDWFSGDLFETLPAAVYVCDAEGIVVAYNHRATELWGRTPTPGDTDEKYCGSYKLFHPDGVPLPHHETPMAAVLRTGTPARDKEVVIERPDSTRITALVNIAPLFGDDRKLVGAVNCFQDLSAIKLAERERGRLADELHQAQKVEAIGQLAAGIVHDFNNLLMAPQTSVGSRVLIEMHSQPGLWLALVATPDGVTLTIKKGNVTLGAAVAPTAERVAIARPQIDLFRMERVRQVVRRHLRTPTLRPRTLCRLVGMSRSNLYRLLEAKGGIAQYIQQQRLLEAHALLGSPDNRQPITALADDFCFADVSSFSRAFRREFGCSPSDVRRSVALTELAAGDGVLNGLHQLGNAKRLRSN
jgi:AraC-like DNA-binding protein